MGKQSRFWGGLGFTFLLTILLIGVAVPVLACYPVISVDFVCRPNGMYQVSGQAAPWDGGGLERLTNPSIEVHRGGYDGPLVASGAFVIVGEDVPGFYWTDETEFPGNKPQDVTYVVVAKGIWGGSTPEAPRGPDNFHRDQTVTISLPGTCVGEENPGSITVKKVAGQAPNSTWLFDLSGQGSSDPVAGDGVDSFTWSELEAGTYALTENKGAGWQLGGVSCGDVEVSTITGGVSVSLTEGADVTCTFTNRQDVSPPQATVAATAAATGAIGDLVWEDSNSDGHQGDFEVGVGGVTVNLLNSSGLIAATTVTDTGGKYLFTGLAAGTYEVQFIVPAGFEVSPLRAAGPALDSDAGVAGRTGLITLAAGQTDLTWDAGIYEGMSRVEVLPQVITATTVTTVAQTSETLPVTGISEGPTGGVALALLMLGGLVVLAINRREQGAVIVAEDWYSRLNAYDPKYQ